MLQLAERLEGHELMIRLWGPCIDLYGFTQRNHQKLDSLILDNLEVNGTLEITNVDPA
jgi:hypothetical protein